MSTRNYINVVFDTIKLEIMELVHFNGLKIWKKVNLFNYIIFEPDDFKKV